MTDKEEYYFVSYAWRTRSEWSDIKEKLKQEIIPKKEGWNFAV